MNNTLFILGNGFDLAHGIKTSFDNYSDWLKVQKKYNSVYTYLSKMNQDNWSDFEENLTKLDVNEILSNFEDLLSNHDADSMHEFYPYEDAIYGLIKKIHQDIILSINEWIFSKEDYLKIHKTYSFPKNSTFISFNYTKTLEKLYKIEDVYHIHNICEKPTPLKPDERGIEIQLPKIVVGHNKTIIVKGSIKNKYKGMAFYSFDNGLKELQKYFDDFKKPFEKLKLQLDHILTKSINKVYVIGHKIGTVDIEYFKKIATLIADDAIWEIGFYNQHDKNWHKEQFNNFKNKRQTLNQFDSSKKFDF